jgi:integrase
MARNDCIALRQLSQWATKAHIFAVDPLRGIELPRGRGGRRKPFRDAEVPAIIKAASDSALGPRDRAVVILGLSAALRPAELWQLQLQDIDLRDGWLMVRLETTKTDAGERSIPLDPQAVAALDEYVSDYRGRVEGPLFLNNRGAAFRYWGFMQLFARLRKRLRDQGIDFSSYRMRHTGITNWARSGVEAPILKQLAGHKSIVTTQNYIGQMSRSDLARIPRAFSDIYGRAV